MTLWRFAAPIASAGWTFIAQLPEDDALSLVHHQARRATAGLALALLLILVGIWIAAGRIARPLARLEVAAREIAQGNLTLSLWSDSRDEIGNLTRSFGDMAQRLSEREGQLRDLNRNLEHRVEDRTRALADAEERSRLLLDSAGEGIFGVGPDGCLSFINPAGARMLGYRAEELVGREIHPLIHHSFRSGSPYPVEACPMHRAHTQGVAGKVDDEVLWRRDGSNFDVEYTSRPIRKDGDLVGAVVVFRDVSELLALNRNFVALLENTPDFIYIKDTEHRITACSRSIASLTGHRDWRELIGKTNSDIFPREQAEKYDHLEREVIAKGREQLNHEATYQDHNGELRWVRTNQHPIRDQTGNIAGMFGISTDITAIKHLAQDLEQARDAAEQANRAKSDFLANMSHEIRTPMNAVIGMTHLCLQTNLSGKQRGYLEKVQEAARGLLGIINDILDFSKIEAGKLDMELSPFDLEEVLEKVTSLIGLKARDKGLELLLDLEQAVPRGLVGDPLRLGQVLINLANNAVKFTDSGEIVIGVCVEREDPERVTLAFSVRDTGIGIPPETQARLFRSFTQADSSTTRKYGGSGLGLTICKRLVGMMQGTIGVASIVGEGSDFHFTASFGRQPEAAQGRPSRVELSGSHALVGDDDSGARAARRIEEQEAMSQLRGSRVLLVEDNAINQEVAVEILSGAGVEVRTANDGVEALEALKEERFDGVLMDVQMPRLDGYEATRAIRRDPEHRDLPIVAMTASAMAGDREKALQAGMNDHLPKPIDVEELFSIMSKWMRPAAPGVQPLLETGVPRKGEPPDLPHLPGLNMREALARLRGNRDLYRRLLVRFSEEQCHFPENYRAALAAGDRETAIRLAHTLKGVAGNLGAEPLQALAETLEQRTRRGEDAGGTLEDAETDLRELLAGIEAVQRPNEEARPALTEVAAADLEALGEEISRLASCLEDFDAAAIGIFEGIRQQLAAVVSRTKLDRLQRELDGFDFPQALDTLNSLAAEMGTDLSSG